MTHLASRRSLLRLTAAAAALGAAALVGCGKKDEAPAAPAASAETAAPPAPAQAAEPLKAAWIYVGPVGSARTRFELEVEDSLSPAGVLELAWTTGKIVWETSPTAGWHDAASGDPLTEAEVVERFHEEIEAGVGIRRYRDDNQMIDNTAPLMVSVFLEEDTSFVVRTREEADAFVEADPARTRANRRNVPP